MEDLYGYDFLALDDIGAENDDFKVATDKLCMVLTRREKKHTLITTNISMDAWAQRFDARVEDRLLRNAEVVDMNEVPSFSVWKLTQKK